ncbi:MAG: stage II sporulation protein M [Candidatus Bathyarchaeia archaeon]
MFDFWKPYPSIIKRILTFAVVFLLSAIITAAGALTPLSQEEADSLNEELEQLRENISVQYIFGNNFMICLLMFVPVVGPLFGFYALYTTGVFIAAQSIAYNVHPLLTFLSMFILPVIWLEFAAYSIAMGESIWLIWRIIHGKGKSELLRACIFISICAVLLLVAAIVEVVMIALIPQEAENATSPLFF